ncbi:MAG: hypothetical protein KIT43_03090 [Bauldia sp.]|nr:hypothetical protein [Bauldia sp.]MCW5713488.1 hypothetical protein [Bauldia sp.]
MTRSLKTLLAASIALGTVGVATAASAQPYVVMPVVINPQACDLYAQNYATGHAGPKNRQVIVGTLLGAGAGFLVGGFGFGAPGVGAAVGAGVGALGGAAIGNPQWNAAYNAAFSACMQGYALPY